MSEIGAALDGRLVAFGYLYLTIQNILSTLIGVLGYAILTRSISQVDVGAIAGLTLLATLFQLLSDFGLSSSLAKFVSELKGRGEGSLSYLLSTLIFRFTIASSSSLFLPLFPDWFSTLLFKTTIYSQVIRFLSIDLLLLSVNLLIFRSLAKDKAKVMRVISDIARRKKRSHHVKWTESILGSHVLTRSKIHKIN